ncbi:MAG TPA: RNA polymerase sigma-70 factor [Flavisolibacter sp.]|nr:RNA polymerase sigma-70 factor [Flavisolibacter sp.]
MSIDQNILTQKGFENLFNQLYERLCRSSFRIVQNEHTAEDIVQEVFCALWKKKEELRIDSYEGYLFRSVYNASINTIKKRDFYAFKEIEEETTQFPDLSITPEEKLQLSETQLKITKVIDNLPTACRAIFVLSRFENRSNKEIANELGLSIKTVENQMTKALRLLRQALLFMLLIFQKII